MIQILQGATDIFDLQQIGASHFLSFRSQNDCWHYNLERFPVNNTSPSCDVCLSCSFCNWFLLADVLKRLKMSARIFRARYPHFEVVSLSQAELWRQVSISQVNSALASPQRGKNKEDDEDEEEEGLVELVCCVPELQRLLGSSIHILQEDEDEEEEEERLTSTGNPRSR